MYFNPIPIPFIALFFVASASLANFDSPPPSPAEAEPPGVHRNRRHREEAQDLDRRHWSGALNLSGDENDENEPSPVVRRRPVARNLLAEFDEAAMEEVGNAHDYALATVMNARAQLAALAQRPEDRTKLQEVNLSIGAIYYAIERLRRLSPEPSAALLNVITILETRARQFQVETQHALFPVFVAILNARIANLEWRGCR